MSGFDWEHNVARELSHFDLGLPHTKHHSSQKNNPMGIEMVTRPNLLKVYKAENSFASTRHTAKSVGGGPA